MQATSSFQLTQFNLKLQAHASRLASLLVLAFAMGGNAAAQPVPALVPPQAGPYGFVVNTTSTVPLSQGGVAVLGVINFDGAGNVSGTYTLELGTGGQGGPQEPVTVTGSLTGKYFPNPYDPNGITWETDLTLDLGTAGNLTGNFVMVVGDHGKGLQLALTGCTGPICDLTGNVVSGVGEAQFGGSVHPLHTGLLNGNYGMQSTKSSPSPQTSVEVWSFDGAGNVTISAVYVQPPVPGSVGFPSDPHTVPGTVHGTYAVNPDGTGTITVPPPPGGSNTKTWVFVITNGPAGLLALQTNRAGDGVLYEVGQLQ